MNGLLLATKLSDTKLLQVAFDEALLQLPSIDRINGKSYLRPLRTETPWTKLGKNGMRALKN